MDAGFWTSRGLHPDSWPCRDTREARPLPRAYTMSWLADRALSTPSDHHGTALARGSAPQDSSSTSPFFPSVARCQQIGNIRDMPFEFKTVLEHGTSNPIAARLSLQILEILNHCNASKDIQENVRDLYMNSLLKKLMRCWEIKERFKKELADAVNKYKPPAGVDASVLVPQIARLEEECHDFLYGAKNFVRDVLQVVNHLYGTDFKEASEFYSAKKKGSQSLVEFVEKTFGPDDGKTKFLKDAVPSIEDLIRMRNAVDHPGGFSGKLIIKNITLAADKTMHEPRWHRERGGKAIYEPSSIRADMETCIYNLLFLGEGIFVSWASDHLKVPGLMCVACIPENERNPDRPIKWTVTLSQGPS